MPRAVPFRFRTMTAGILPMDVLAGRSPRLLLRFAQRALEAVLLKLPPRFTRLRNVSKSLSRV